MDISSLHIDYLPEPSADDVALSTEPTGRYMLTIPWSKASGWGQPRIGPLQDLKLNPLSGVLQYAVTCFEGMKCYKTDQGDLRLFRPTKNSERLKRSAARLGLPFDWDDDDFVTLIGKLVALEAERVPATDGANLYIRPTLVETSTGFGLRSDALATEALLYVATAVNLGVGIYSSVEGQGLKLDACSDYIRAWPGGTGSYKLGANYGTVHVAKKPGFAMNLWLHGKEDFISEAGGMNVWIIKQAPDGFTEFITMGLDNGIVLPGITRASMIELLREHADGTAQDTNTVLDGVPRNIRVVERDIDMKEILDGLEDGTLKGMFGCGTGVVVVSIGTIQYKSHLYTIPANPITKILRDTFSGIQRGRIVVKDWSWKVAPAAHAPSPLLS